MKPGTLKFRAECICGATRMTTGSGPYKRLYAEALQQLQEAVAQPGPMSFADFHNGLRILINLDLPDLWDVGLFTESNAVTNKDGWLSFRDNPWRYLITASDRQAAMIGAAMQKRMAS